MASDALIKQSMCRAMDANRWGIVTLEGPKKPYRFVNTTINEPA
jgi:hypothetical protein